MNKIQIIQDKNKPKFAILDWNLFINIKNTLEKNKDIEEIQNLLEYFEDLPESNKKTFTNPVIEMRKEAKMTQKELANAMDVSQPYIAKLEKMTELPETIREKVKNAIDKKNSGMSSLLNIFKS